MLPGAATRCRTGETVGVTFNVMLLLMSNLVASIQLLVQGYQIWDISVHE